ncbi:hypothetical protein [Salidesulfovibrio brasiliensis]|uniref:hypothetical protein n=1 Tax=Salidesulfovibrio brasiliensis TaxID=221711 RepID=UPI001FE14485|nr:hypothetical protein [Salidesulfovibrio brasiliensis]
MNEVAKSTIKARLTDSLNSIIAAGHEESHLALENFADDADYATQLTAHSMALALKERDREKVQRIEEALERINSPEFGSAPNAATTSARPASWPAPTPVCAFAVRKTARPASLPAHNTARRARHGRHTAQDRSARAFALFQAPVAMDPAKNRLPGEFHRSGAHL